MYEHGRHASTLAPGRAGLLCLSVSGLNLDRMRCCFPGAVLLIVGARSPVGLAGDWVRHLTLITLTANSLGGAHASSCSFPTLESGANRPW